MMHNFRRSEMAIVCLTGFAKYSPRLTFLRLLDHRGAVKLYEFSTSIYLADKKSEPVKYTTNRVANMRITETIGLEKEEPKNHILHGHRFILVGVFAIFILYFCVLREENDIDEMLKGNTEYMDKTRQLQDLKIKLKFCEQNKLPRDAIKAKIEELEEGRSLHSSFRK